MSESRTHPALELAHTLMSEDDALRLLEGHRIRLGSRTMDPKATARARHRLMRVAFDARVLLHPATAERGVGRYAGSLLAALRDGGRDVVTLEHLRRPPAPARVAELFEHALLARDVRRAAADVLHSPSIDFATLRPGAPYVVTVHDLVPLEQPETYLRTGLKHRLRYRAAAQATRLIVPTHAVAEDCERLLHVPPERIDVIHEAPAPVFRPAVDPGPALARFHLPERFLVWVGGLDPPDPRKGVADLAGAVAAGHGPPLVLAGRVGPDAADLRAEGRVLLAGRVTDLELAALYGSADALVFPSSEEGFGLPVAEALACGCPVAAYDIPALREQWHGRDDVRLVEPGDVHALLLAAEALAGVSVNPPRRGWGDVAEETWRTYERAAGR
jgi:glycosyltransferase involved in cell wall biosynthesis